MTGTDQQKYSPTMRAERVADVYGGESCDQHIPKWRAYAYGDMGDETSAAPLTFKPEDFPVGTRVRVEVPVCPKCDQDAQLCREDDECDFDWKRWAEDRYA